MKNLRAEHATLIGAAVNILLSVLKLAVGVVATSGALVADGVHSLSDLVTDAAVLLGIRAAQRPPDTNHAYGHGRYETLAALFVGVMLLAAAVGILLHSWARIADGLAGEILLSPRPVAIIVAAASIVAKEIMFHITRRIGRLGGSPALVANAWHHRSDALSSVATLIGVGGAALLGSRWNVLDPAAAGVVACMIAWVGVQTSLTALREMTDHALPPSDHAVIKRIVLSVPGTSDPHNLKTRRLGSDVSIEVHFRVDGQISVNDGHDIASEVESRIRHEFGESSTIITHVEPTLDR
ncbi:MAG: cation diffusion facilitator family transporter [Alkalispirochaeta sp.]